jgi:methylenetetrahydrofolate--tRNA-(uracil-5-)-methyltransferase
MLAGQIVGVEGYVESAAMGLLAGINALRIVKDLKLSFLHMKQLSDP